MKDCSNCAYSIDKGACYAMHVPFDDKSCWADAEELDRREKAIKLYTRKFELMYERKRKKKRNVIAEAKESLRLEELYA